MKKTQKHYLMWCEELDLTPSYYENTIKFMEADNVYYSDDNGEIYIDDKNEMELIEEFGSIFYRHEMDVNFMPTLYELLEN